MPAQADPDPPSLRPIVSFRGWQVDFSGFVQADSVIYNEESQDDLDPVTRVPLNQERFFIHRARIRTDIKNESLSGAIEIDGNTIAGPNAHLLEAWGRWTGPSREGKPLVAVTMGLFPIPFGVETPSIPRNRLFLEQPTVVRALFPGNLDGGAMAQGSFGYLRWSAAIMNGAPVGDTQWKGVDPTSSYDFIGRIGAEITGPDQLVVQFGVSGLSGTALHPGIPATKDQLVWNDANGDGMVQPSEINEIPGTPAEPSQTFHHDAAGADVAVRYCVIPGPGVAFAEAIIATDLDRAVIYADPVANARELRELGYQVGIVQNITKSAQVGVRYDYYDGDRDAHQMIGVAIVNTHQIFSTLSFMAAALWNGARFTAEYDHQRNPFGIGDNGAPTTKEDDQFTLRVQVGF